MRPGHAPDQPPRVLVVDDDEETRQLTAEVLTRAGYAVSEAGSCGEALESVPRLHPVLVLLDRNLPDGDGLEVCRAIKRSPALDGTRVVIASAALTGPAEQIDGLKAGADGYLVRPIGTRELLARVDAFVRQPELATDLRRRAESLAAGPAEDSGSLLHELRVHQIELELQNEELRRSQLEVEAERDRFARLYHGAPTGYASLDENAVVRETNATLCELLKARTEAVLGHPLSDFLEPASRHVFLSRYRAFFRSPEDKVIDLELAPRGGPGRAAVLTGRRAAQADDPRAPSLLHVVLQDTTARRLAERRLTTSNAILRIISTLNESLLRQGTPGQVYDEACRVAVEEGGYDGAWVVSPGAEGAAPQLLARHGVAPAPGEVPLAGGRLPAGIREVLTFPLAAEAAEAPVLTIGRGAAGGFEAGEAELLARFAADVAFGIRFASEQDRRREAEEALRRALLEKEALLREVHHRVKNNLQAIIFLVDGYRELVKGSEERVLLEELQAKTRAMALVYQQLHDARDLAAVRMKPYLVQLVSLLAQAFDAERRALVEVDVAAPEELPELTMDVERAVPCGLVVNELVTNAMKYAVPAAVRPEVRVRLSRTGDTFSLAVSDNGPGLPPPSERRDSAMGLELVQLWVVHQLGGTYRLLDGPGASFQVEFPAGRRGGR